MDVATSLNKIADTLQININYEDGKVSGVTDMLYCPLPGLSIPVKLTLQKFFANETVGVVAHVIGNLYIVASHLNQTGVVNVFLIDGSRLEVVGVRTPPEALISKTMGIKQVVAALRGAIIKSYLWKDRRWSVLNLPS